MTDPMKTPEKNLQVEESQEKNNVVNANVNNQASPFLTGGRLRSATIALCLCIWLANLEVTIVSTSLVSITDELRSFSRSSWIILAYLLTYTCLLIIWAKLSDIFGRKLSIVSSMTLFTVFSVGCGAAQTTTQLIVCRAFQGIGGSGAYSLTVVIFFEMVPKAKYALYTSLVSTVFALSLLLGPLIGGAINDNTTWRWVFLLNAPAGAIAIGLLLLTIPNNFPRHNQPSEENKKFLQLFAKSSLQRLDLFGTFMLLAASMLFVASLQTVGINHSWSSATFLAMVIISCALWIFFFCWECYITGKNDVIEPVFPWRFLKNRIWIGTLVHSFLAGISFTVPVVEIPLRFQAVYGTSPLKAGISLLPFAICTSVGTISAAMMASRLKTPPVFIMLVGTALQVVGFALLSTIPITESIWKGQYGYEVLSGLGMGANAGLLVVITPYVVEKRDQREYLPCDAVPRLMSEAVAMGSIVQLRMMGGAIGLAVATCILNSYTQSNLSAVLSPDQLHAVLEQAGAIQSLQPAMQETVISVFAKAFAIQFRVLIGTSAAQYLMILLMWQTKLLRVA